MNSARPPVFVPKTNASSPPTARSALLGPLGLLLLATFAFLWKGGDRGLWTGAERVAARAARHAIEGRYASAGEGTTPFHAWTMAASCRWVGDTGGLGLRLPSAAAMFVLLFALVRFVRRAFDSRTAILTGVVLATSVGAMVGARIASPDALLAASTTVVSVSLFTARSEVSRLAWLAPCIAMGIGYAASGPMAVLLPSSSVLLYDAIDGGRRTPRPVLGAVLLAVATGVAVAATESLPPFVGEFPRESVLSTSGPVPGLLLALAPWVVFLPSVAAQVTRDVAARRGAAGVALCCLAVAAAYGFTAGVSGATLGLLLLPWTSLLVARFWVAALQAPGPDALRRTVGLPFATTVIAMPVVAWLARERVQTDFGVPESLTTQACVFLLFVSIGLVTLVIYRDTLPRFGGLAAASLLTMAFAALWVVPRIEETRGGRRSIEEVLRHVQPSCEVRTAGLAGREDLLDLVAPGLPDVGGEGLIPYLASEARVYCLMDYSLFAYLAAHRTSNLHLVITRPARGGSLALVTNRPETKGRKKEDP